MHNDRGGDHGDDDTVVVDTAISLYKSQYDNWVSSNVPLARNIENLLYLLPQMIPERLGDPTITTEMVYSSVGLLKFYHDCVLSKESHSNVDKYRLPLTIISHLQVTLEALVQKYASEDAQLWNVIVLVELLKCMLKWQILKKTRDSSGMLIKGGQYVSTETTTTTIQDSVKDTNNNHTSIISFSPAVVSTSNSVSLNLLQAGEVLHIIRPVLYALMRRYASKKSSWIPVSTSLAVELSGIACSILAVKEKVKKDNVAVADEIARRKLCLIFYLLRNPIFTRFTKPAADSFVNSTSGIPLMGRLTAFAVQYGLFYYQQYHFYTAASS